MNKYVRKEIDFVGKKLVLETGELAVRANMAVKASYGDTVVLLTVVSGDANPDVDFFPLTVNYEEKLYSSGIIKNSRFVKRDGKSSDDAIIAQRAIDHAIRPLFPKDYADEVQVVATVLSLDKNADPEFLAMVAASAALTASNVPWKGPMATGRVGLIDDQLVLCPNVDDLETKSDMDMVVSFVGREKRFLAVEAGMNVLPETKVLEAINFVRDAMDPLLGLIEEFANEVNPNHEKYEYLSHAVPDELVKVVTDFAGAKFQELYGDHYDRDVCAKAKAALAEELFKKFEGTYKKVDMQAALDDAEKKVIRTKVLTEEKRIDGRSLTEIRPLSSKVSVLPRTHGSALFTRGETQALTVATLGSPSLELLVQDMYGERSKRFLHYYNFPPFSTGETGRFGSPKGREIGHGMIGEKGLKAVMPDQNDFPYTVILVSEILSSNGSSSMAATCGSTLALMDAGVPIKGMVGGVAMGLMVSDYDFTQYKIITDLCGEEDFSGFLDFKMTGTREGVTAIQCDMKVPGMPMKVLEEVIAQSREGRLVVLDSMEKTISKPKESVSDYAPKMVTLKIDPAKIGMVIGTGGKTIKEIQEQTGSEISIEEDGSVVITSVDKAGAEKAYKIVDGLTRDLQVGEVYDGVVKDLLDFGALVEIMPGRVGLLHVSEITNAYIKDVHDVLKIGDPVTVKIVGLGAEGKISLSKKAIEMGDAYENTFDQNSRGRGNGFGGAGRGHRDDRRGDRGGFRPRR